MDVFETRLTVISGDNTDDVRISYEVIQGENIQQDGENGPHVLNDQGDRVKATLLIGEYEELNSLEEGTRLTLIVQAQSGGSSFKSVQAPRNIDEGNSYIL